LTTHSKPANTIAFSTPIASARARRLVHAATGVLRAQ
jgi:hypothetical protein